MQEIYNFLEGSPKRSEIFKATEIDQDDSNVTTLKNQGATRWGAKQDSVISVSKNLKRCVKVLALLVKERDAQVSSKARSILKNIYGEEFIFGVTLLDTILTPTNRLSDFLQGRNVDMRKARERVQLLISTMEGLKSKDSFDELWRIAHDKATDLVSFVDEDDSLEIYFDFEEAKVPRRLKSTKSAQEYYQVTHYDAALDKIILELNAPLLEKDKDIVLDLVTIVNDAKVDDEVLKRVGNVYNLDFEDLKSEHFMFQHFKVTLNCLLIIIHHTS